MTDVEQKVRDAYETFKEHSEQNNRHFREFVKACQEAHAKDVSDERISILIDREFSRQSIQKLRKGKMRKGLNCG